MKETTVDDRGDGVECAAYDGCPPPLSHKMANGAKIREDNSRGDIEDSARHLNEWKEETNPVKGGGQLLLYG
jgi:hypothetical protein